MLIFWKCYVKPGKADIVQIPFKEKQAEEAANCTKCIDLSPKVTEVRSHFLLLPLYCALSTLGYELWPTFKENYTPLEEKKNLTRKFSLLQTLYSITTIVP